MRILHLLLLVLAYSGSLTGQSTSKGDSLLNLWIDHLDQATLLDSINHVVEQVEEKHFTGLDTLFVIKHQILKKNGSRTEEINNVVSYTFYLVKSFKPQKAKDFIAPYYEELKQIEGPLHRADVLYAYGHTHEDLRENERAFALMNEAVEIYEEVADSSYKNYTSSLIAMSRVGFTISNYPASSIALNKAKSLALRNKDSTALRGVYQDLTILFSQVGLYDQAEGYWNERSKYFSSPESKESKAIGLVNLGRNLILQDRWEEALNNYHEAQSLSPFSGAWTFLDLYNYNGIIECLYFLNEWDSIPHYFDLMQEKFSRINRSVTYEFLLKQSQFFTRIVTGQFSVAEDLGLALLSDAEKSNDGAEIMMHARFLAELYQDWGLPAKALQYTKKYVRLKDSIQTANRTNALLLYQTQFETAEKENVIYRLEKEGELLQAKVERNRLLKALLIAGLALLVFIGIIIYYRIKQQELERMQKLRMGISSDLHDEVGSLLSGITMQTQMLNMVPEAKRGAFIREIGDNTSRAVSTMRDLVWSIDSRRDKIEDLIDKISDTCHQLLEPAGFKYKIDLGGNIDHLKKLNPKAKKEIYLIAKEALNNIVKHSNGSKVSIILTEKNGLLKLTILDDGTKSKIATTSGQGLDNMQYRSQQINGQLQVSQDFDGYRVVLSTSLN
ncbi:MAG: hypothetical protein HKN87_11810 [Saprospiraceae bacterium]|nr:hypothetical protein [Saprospiraceae bacterium]